MENNQENVITLFGMKNYVFILKQKVNKKSFIPSAAYQNKNKEQENPFIFSLFKIGLYS